MKLTHSERNVLRLIARGHSSAEAAAKLYVSKRTVDFHLANVYRKTKTHNRIACLRAVAAAGIILEPNEPRGT